ncbi:hypothetical protein MIDIC_280004 [Alphaproteobacteria bacterium]
MIRPGYSTLQDLISETCNNEKFRISNKLYKVMGSSLRRS